MDIFRVSFIGHRVVDEYRQVEEELDEVIELLHRKYGFIDFNVGRNGEFDDLATQAVRRFRREWEEWCELTLVEPYPVANLDIIEKSYDSVIIPTDRKCHYKAAIGERNKWLAENCDTKDYIINYQDLQGIGITGKLALPTLISLCSIALGRSTLANLVVIGDISISGTLIKADELANVLQVCLDSGAKKVLLPSTSFVDFATVPADLMSAFQLIPYTSAEDAVYKALGVE